MRLWGLGGKKRAAASNPPPRSTPGLPASTLRRPENGAPHVVAARVDLFAVEDYASSPEKEHDVPSPPPFETRSAQGSTDAVSWDASYRRTDPIPLWGTSPDALARRIELLTDEMHQLSARLIATQATALEAGQEAKALRLRARGESGRLTVLAWAHPDPNIRREAEAQKHRLALAEAEINAASRVLDGMSLAQIRLIGAATARQEVLVKAIHDSARAPIYVPLTSEDAASLPASMIDHRPDGAWVTTSARQLANRHGGLPTSPGAARIWQVAEADFSRRARPLWAEFLAECHDGVQLSGARTVAADTLEHSLRMGIGTVGSADTTREFLRSLREAAQPYAEREEAAMLAHKQQSHPAATRVEPWEVTRLANESSAPLSAIDYAEIAEHLEPMNVQGRLLAAMSGMLGTSLDLVPDERLWHSSVYALELTRGPKVFGKIHVDFEAREGKRDGAWAINLSTGRDERAVALLGTLGIHLEDGRAVIEAEGLKDLAHELAHALSLLLEQERKGRVEGDAAELISIFFEKWVLRTDVLRYITTTRDGRALSDEVLARLQRTAQYPGLSSLYGNATHNAAALELFTHPEGQLDLDRIRDGLGDTAVSRAFSSDLLLLADEFVLELGPTAVRYAKARVAAENLLAQFPDGQGLSPTIGQRLSKQVIESAGTWEQGIEEFIGGPISLEPVKQRLEREAQGA